MEHLNFHHLRLFRAVAHEGNLTRASRSLHLAPQTVSGQIRELEASLGEALFLREGRRLVLTEVGKVVRSYADEIFGLGRELQETLRGQPAGRALRLKVGVVDVLPKLVAYRLLEPAFTLEHPVHILCREGPPEALLAQLATHELDIVLLDRPIPDAVNVRAHNHLLGRCGVTFLARPERAEQLRAGFPGSLDGEPVLLPAEGSALRSELDRWFADHGLQPRVAGEFEDSALLKVFGQAGMGFYAVPSVVEEEAVRQYEVEALGSTDEITASFYMVSVERRLRHPAVVAIGATAREELFS
ncbi:MAG: LysR family transcriptional regulator [Deltaproteobacteria bacterium]|nr:LysR family transcriptional regulator [Deltaproteobacteria bacterium]